MKYLIAAILLSVATIGWSASPILPGGCPKVKTVPVNLKKVLGLWWRPYRSQFNDDEPVFRCLRTGWTDLRNRTFAVVDYNIRKKDNVVDNLYGNITARTNDIADWDIAFTTGFKVNAQILDIVEDEYMFMFVCNTIGNNSHTNNGIVFTRQQHPAANKMGQFMGRVFQTIYQQKLDGVEMKTIDLDNCPATDE